MNILRLSFLGLLLPSTVFIRSQGVYIDGRSWHRRALSKQANLVYGVKPAHHTHRERQPYFLVVGSVFNFGLQAQVVLLV